MQGVTFGPRDPLYTAPRKKYLPVQLSAGVQRVEKRQWAWWDWRWGGGGVQVYAPAKVHLPTTLGCCTQKRRMGVEEEGRTRR